MSQPDYVEETNELALMALREAKRILEFGPSQQKMQIVRGVLAVLARQAAAGHDAVGSEMRVRMEILMADLRNVPEIPLVVTDTDFVEAEPADDD